MADLECEQELDAIQRRLLELSELFPLTFWKNLDRLNVQEQRTPRWSFLINANGIQCNIYWENKTEQEKLEEDALLGGEALKRAEKWLQDAQNSANDESLSQDDINKTVQSILSFFSPLNNNNSSQRREDPEKTADGLLNKLKTKLATTDAKKRKAPRPAPSPNPTKVSRKVVSQSKPSKTETPSPPVVVGVKNVVPIAPKKPGQHNLKSKKILCYMPQTLNKNFTVKIPAKPEKPSSQVPSPVFHVENRSVDSDEEIVKIEPFEADVPDDSGTKEIKLKISPS